MKNVVLTLALALAASSAAAHAQTAALPAPPAEQARTVQYHSQDIVPIRAKVKYTTLIVVPADRKDHGGRDRRQGLLDCRCGGQLLLCPPGKSRNISSNLNLITDKGNIYSFTLQDITTRAATRT